MKSWALIVGVLLLAFGGSVNANPLFRCTSNANCRPLLHPTVDAGFCNTTTGECECYTELGFTVGGPLVDRCTCASPKAVSGRYCVECPLLADNAYIESQMHAAVEKAYQACVWPGSVPIVLAGGDNIGVVAPWFAPDVEGRVLPTGSYPGAEKTLEYFYGLAGPIIDLSDPAVAADPIGSLRPRAEFFPASPAYLMQEVRKVVQVADAATRTVSVRYDFLFRPIYSNLMYTALSSPGAPCESLSIDSCELLTAQNLTEVGFFYFNNDLKIQKYDLSILRLGSLWGFENPVLGVSVVDSFVQSVCLADQAYCLPTGFTEYDDLADCVSFLSSVPQGSFDNCESNTLACRIIHAALVPIRPDIHCAHIGKSGGGACVNKPYNRYYQNDFYPLF